MLLAAILLAPLLGAGAAHADAADTPAGFAPSIWLSRSSVADGDRVTVYTAVYDSAEEAISGTVVFLVDGASIGSKPFSLAAGASSIVSADWRASAGTHALSARIDGATGKTSGRPIAVADATSEVRVAVAAAPPPTGAKAAASAAGKAVDAAAPVVIETAQAVLAGTESLRQAGADYFAGQLAGAGDAAGTSTENGSAAVLGTTTYRAPAQAASAAASRFMQSADRALLALFSSPALFYFALLALLLLFFWFIKRRFGSDGA